MGTIACLQDTEVINFVHTQGKRAKWITSDCTGSLILGAAGLLDGYRATCNWAVGDLLPLFGAIGSAFIMLRRCESAVSCAKLGSIADSVPKARNPLRSIGGIIKVPLSILLNKIYCCANVGNW